MINIDIPSYKKLDIEYIIFDYNGTLGFDGIVEEHTKSLLNKLSEKVKLYVLTADTNGNARKNLEGCNVELKIISKENGAQDKLKTIKELGTSKCIAIGNGYNDRLMLKHAELSICISSNEGCNVQAMSNSDIVINDINRCIELFIHTNRLIATLRG
ncbi:HAD family hydrolase [Abyssisolibacter fermentans]|uniref:HAD family hydrolase n=1 Tax=Abyssisolibacter fermentans TaxID=1766203 RepID=UPI00083653EC|nr:HAD hydrolase family protein [Abyssisolibacter fermentans]